MSIFTKANALKIAKNVAPSLISGAVNTYSTYLGSERAREDLDDARRYTETAYDRSINALSNPPGYESRVENARGNIQSSYDRSINALSNPIGYDSRIGNVRGNIQSAYDRSINALSNPIGYDSRIGNVRGNIQSAYDRSINALSGLPSQSTYSPGGQKAFQAQQDLLGLGGDPTKQRKAFETFKGSAGYKDALREGTEAIAGSRAASGLLGSGETNKSLMRYGHGLSRKAMGDYMNQLNQQASFGLTAEQPLQSAYLNRANTLSNFESSLGVAREQAIQSGNLNRANTLSNFESSLGVAREQAIQSGNLNRANAISNFERSLGVAREQAIQSGNLNRANALANVSSSLAAMKAQYGTMPYEIGLHSSNRGMGNATYGSGGIISSLTNAFTGTGTGAAAGTAAGTLAAAAGTAAGTTAAGTKAAGTLAAAAGTAAGTTAAGTKAAGTTAAGTAAGTTAAGTKAAGTTAAGTTATGTTATGTTAGGGTLLEGMGLAGQVGVGAAILGAALGTAKLYDNWVKSSRGSHGTQTGPNTYVSTAEGRKKDREFKGEIYNKLIHLTQNEINQFKKSVSEKMSISQRQLKMMNDIIERIEKSLPFRKKLGQKLYSMSNREILEFRNKIWNARGDEIGRLYKSIGVDIPTNSNDHNHANPVFETFLNFREQPRERLIELYFHD